MKPHIRNRHRVASVGNLLAEGPFSIRPPRTLDDYGWLECDLRFMRWSGGIVESAAVYVDDSMNREEDFLPPVLRYCRWDQVGDMKRALAQEISWPTATISLSYLELARYQVDTLIRGVQTQLCSPPFLVSGLVTDRSVPDVEADPQERISVMSRNGLQRVEYYSVLADDLLAKTASAGIALLRDLVEPIDLDGWRESYSHEITSPDHCGSRWWDYKSVQTEA